MAFSICHDEILNEVKYQLFWIIYNEIYQTQVSLEEKRKRKEKNDDEVMIQSLSVFDLLVWLLLSGNVELTMMILATEDLWFYRGDDCLVMI